MNAKVRFNEKIAAMKADQSKNVKMFTDEDYAAKIARIKEIKAPGHKMIPQDYGLLRKFEILQVEKDGKMLERLVKVNKKDGVRPRFATYETLYDSILEYHAEAGKHTGRLLTFKKLKERYANITMQ